MQNLNLWVFFSFLLLKFQRNFIRHGGDTANLYEKFKEWLCDDRDIDWMSIMEEDSHIPAGASQLRISHGLEIQNQDRIAGN